MCYRKTIKEGGGKTELRSLLHQSEWGILLNIQTHFKHRIEGLGVSEDLLETRAKY